MARKKEEKHAFSVSFPSDLVQEIDVICASHYITRNSWLIRAAKELLEKERKKGTNELIEKIAAREEI